MAEPDGCILYSTADWDTPYWTNKQHMTVDFARRGIRVLYVETVGIRRPKLASGRDLTRILRRLWKAARGMRRVDDNVWVLSPLSIPVGRKFGVIGSFNSFLLRNSVRVASLRLGFASPMTWTYHPYLPDLDRSRTGPLVYHCVDDIAAVPGVDATTYARLEEALVAKSDLTFVTSPGLYELWRKAGPHVHYLPNAVDVGHFAKARDLKPTLDLSSATGPVIGYIGALSDFKVDFKLVLDAVRLRPDWTWVFIGDEREGQRSDDV
ncbi:MAG: hypothetical protein JWN07_2318, partial [Hyphomicrobiales bacterium]|nr:hypothetical protein [Hyphomicrobiales bacterium]